MGGCVRVCQYKCARPCSHTVRWQSAVYSCGLFRCIKTGAGRQCRSQDAHSRSSWQRHVWPLPLVRTSVGSEAGLIVQAALAAEAPGLSASHPVGAHASNVRAWLLLPALPRSAVDTLRSAPLPRAGWAAASWRAGRGRAAAAPPGGPARGGLLASPLSLPARAREPGPGARGGARRAGERGPKPCR
jgi:hypothetical protein